MTLKRKVFRSPSAGRPIGLATAGAGAGAGVDAGAGADVGARVRAGAVGPRSVTGTGTGAGARGPRLKSRREPSPSDPRSAGTRGGIAPLTAGRARGPRRSGTGWPRTL